MTTTEFPDDLALAQVDFARSALAKATTIQETKRFIDLAEATRIYAQRAKAGKEAEMTAAEFVIRGERQLGGMINAAKEAGQITQAPKREVDGDDISRLAEVGISRDLSSRAQQIADIPEALFESTLTKNKDAGVLSRSRVLTQAKRVEKIDEAHAKAAKIPADIEGRFEVLVIDPPWPMQKFERDVRPNQVALDYPTMEEDEIISWGFATEKAENDCHVFLWTTHKFLPLAFSCLESWGFKYTCCFVWHKPGGIQPLNFPQLNCEFCLYARAGNPLFIDPKAFNACFNAPRGSHSEKPEEFYDLLRRVTAGRRLDMFNRRKIEGFIGWGKEAFDEQLPGGSRMVG